LNFLAHAYLSFDDDALIIGNMVSDFVKGKAIEDYTPAIQRGLRLHRTIDAFTDAHPINKEAKKFFSSAVGRYNGAFLDIALDHFLATDPKRFTPDALKSFSTRVYGLLETNITNLPENFREVFHYMKQHDWLYNYASLPGIQRSLEGMVRRARYLPDDAPIYSSFLQHYDDLKAAYEAFFPELEAFVKTQV
jgi:acyl carrier protein phosphodiesterase